MPLRGLGSALWDREGWDGGGREGGPGGRGQMHAYRRVTLVQREPTQHCKAIILQLKKGTNSGIKNEPKI